MSVAESELRKLPLLAALAFSVRCAVLARPSFQNQWDDNYDDAVDEAIRLSIAIASSPRSANVTSPDGYADYCVDLSGYAAAAHLTECSAAANAAAGAAYCAAMIADVYQGYSSGVPDHFFGNVKRAVDAVDSIEGLGRIASGEFQQILALVKHEGLTDFSPVDQSMITTGFGG